MRDKLECNPIMIQMPIGEGDNFRGVIDIINETTLEWPNKDKGLTMKTTKINKGDEYYNLVKKEKAKLIEHVASLDSVIEDMYLEEKVIGAEDLMSSIRRITISRKGTFKNKKKVLQCYAVHHSNIKEYNHY
jgi:elongation factor G